MAVSDTRTEAVPSETAMRYFGAIMEGERKRATGLVMDALSSGLPPAEALSEVVGTSMRMVGQAWQEAQASVAQEHRATAISEHVVQLVNYELASVPRGLRPDEAGKVLFTCVEGEWHLLPVNMAAVALGARGWDVTVLGPSAPPRDLAQLAMLSGPSVVVVTATMATSMPGAWRTVSALREAGMRGFGERARVRGASGMGR